MNELYIGDTGQLIVLLQQFLCMKGFFIACDGVFGMNTKNALVAYQTKNNLPVTGVADEAMITLIQQPTKIDALCLAIKSYEGFIAPCAQYPQGTPAWNNNNPGNLVWENQPHATQNGRFAKFDTYQNGYNALRNLLIRAATGHSSIYNANGTILDMMNVYSPTDDNNDPNKYATFIIGRLGVPADTLLKDLLN